MDSATLKRLVAKDLRATREALRAETERLNVDPCRLHGCFAGPGWLEAERGTAADLADQLPKLQSALDGRSYGPTVVLDCGKGIAIYCYGKTLRLATAEERAEELAWTAANKALRLATFEREAANAVA